MKGRFLRTKIGCRGIQAVGVCGGVHVDLSDPVSERGLCDLGRVPSSKPTLPGQLVPFSPFLVLLPLRQRRPVGLKGSRGSRIKRFLRIALYPLRFSQERATEASGSTGTSPLLPRRIKHAREGGGFQRSRGERSAPLPRPGRGGAWKECAGPPAAAPPYTRKEAN